MEDMQYFSATGKREKEEKNMNEHPVWSILNKEKYVEGFYQQAENMYDFIRAIVSTCGDTTKDGNTVPTMQVFFDMWNEYSHETFRILDFLTHNHKDGNGTETVWHLSPVDKRSATEM